MDLSLRTRLLLFALFLVALPGSVFAWIAFSGARSALEKEVGIQLSQSAEQGADAVSAALERAQGDARAWSAQDLMRDLVVGDLDKRVSRFLATTRVGHTAYVDVICADRQGEIVAASDGRWLGRSVEPWAAMAALRNGGEQLTGPNASIDPGRQVLEIGVPIENPDLPGSQIGLLILLYDWDGIAEILDDIRLKLTKLGKHVSAFVVDRRGRVVGGGSRTLGKALDGALDAEIWQTSFASGYGRRAVRLSGGEVSELLVGSASVSLAQLGWEVMIVEPTSEAFAPVRSIRRRWGIALAVILLLGLAAAVVLARQVVRPLDEVTRATSELVAHLHDSPTLLPVTSRNEVGQLAESFNKMTVELRRSQEEALSAAKFAFAGEIAAMIAHEVRTPLSVMRSSAQMLAQKSIVDDAHRPELAQTIVDEVDRIEKVVTGLLELVNPLQQHTEATSLQGILSRAAALVAAQADRQQVKIATDYTPSPLQALCDPEQIYQVVLNLVVNALQALQPGGSIRLRTFADGSDVVGFSVEDDGPGLPEELRETIFQPFVSARDEGTGLGLAFVERVVRAHRGSVSVESQPGRGTRFHVRLPVAPRST